jgi:hypothetical protein
MSPARVVVVCHSASQLMAMAEQHSSPNSGTQLRPPCPRAVSNRLNTVRARGIE